MTEEDWRQIDGNKSVKNRAKDRVRKDMEKKRNTEN
jgi:hypothetical protein